jgi:hypothetical protein
MSFIETKKDEKVSIEMAKNFYICDYISDNPDCYVQMFNINMISTLLYYVSVGFFIYYQGLQHKLIMTLKNAFSFKT